MISVRNRFHIVLFSMTASVLASFAGMPSSVVRFGSEFARDVMSINSEYTLVTNRLPAKFVHDLEELGDRFQKDGNLDGLLAVKNEIARFKKINRSELDPFESVPDMTDDDIVSSPQELKSLQEDYRRGFLAAKNGCKNKIMERGDRLLADIEEEKTALTKAGRIEEAIAVRAVQGEISNALQSGETADIIRLLGVDIKSLRAEMAAQRHGTAATASNAKTSWNAWRYRAVYPFARELPRYLDPDVPNELTAYFDQIKGVGRVTGTCRTPARQIGDVLCSWIGKAFVWDVAAADALEVDVRIKAKTLSSGAEMGPYVELAVLANGTRLKSISVPVQCNEDRIRIIRRNGGDFELSWPFGKKSRPFTVPAGARLNVLVGIAMHNPGEPCDVSFQLEAPSK